MFSEKLLTKDELTMTHSAHKHANTPLQRAARFDIGILLLRVLPVIMVLHGISKLSNFSGFAAGMEGRPVASIAPTFFAFLIVSGEIVLPILIAAGFFTRIAALLETIMMLGIWLFVPVHGAITSGAGFLTESGGLVGESSLMYLFLTLPVIFLGAGRYSIDAALAKKGNKFFATQI